MYQNAALTHSNDNIKHSVIISPQQQKKNWILEQTMKLNKYSRKNIELLAREKNMTYVVLTIWESLCKNKYPDLQNKMLLNPIKFNCSNGCGKRHLANNFYWFPKNKCKALNPDTALIIANNKKRDNGDGTFEEDAQLSILLKYILKYARTQEKNTLIWVSAYLIEISYNYTEREIAYISDLLIENIQDWLRRKQMTFPWNDESIPTTPEGTNVPDGFENNFNEANLYEVIYSILDLIAKHIDEAINNNNAIWVISAS